MTNELSIYIKDLANEILNYLKTNNTARISNIIQFSNERGTGINSLDILRALKYLKDKKIKRK